MGAESAIPQIVSAFTQDTYAKKYVFAGLANRQYEGEVTPGGSVKVTTVGAASVGTYSKASGVTWNEADVAARILLINQDKYITQTLDLKESIQARPDLAAAIGRGIGKAAANDVDSYIAGLYGSAGVTSGSTGSVVSITSANVLEYFMTVKQGLKDNDTPEDGLVAVIPTWLTTKIVLGKVAEVTDNAMAYAGGYVGRVGGFQVYESTNVYSSGTDYWCPMFFRMDDTIALAEQINVLKQVEREDYFDTAWKARIVYGAKVMRPESLGVGYWKAGSET